MNRLVLSLIVILCGFGFHSPAQDLLITPKRVVFEGNKQKESLSLVNTGSEPATYSISFVQRNMKEDGSFEIIDKPDSGQMFADPYLRVFPRQVTLAPGEAQLVMLQFRRIPNMQSGEYRSHLYFRSEKNYEPLGKDNPLKDSNQVAVQLTPIYGMSIPIIIRVGEVAVSADLSDLKLIYNQDSVPFLNFTVNRTGNISLYGNFTVDYFPVQGKPYEVGAVNGVGVYTNINKRNVSVRLNKSPGMQLKNGKLKLRFSSPEDTKYQVYAEKDLLINE